MRAIQTICKALFAGAVVIALGFGVSEAFTPATPAVQVCEDCTAMGGNAYCDDCCGSDPGASLCLSNGQCVCG